MDVGNAQIVNFTESFFLHSCMQWLTLASLVSGLSQQTKVAALEPRISCEWTSIKSAAYFSAWGQRVNKRTIAVSLPVDFPSPLKGHTCPAACCLPPAARHLLGLVSLRNTVWHSGRFGLRWLLKYFNWPPANICTPLTLFNMDKCSSYCCLSETEINVDSRSHC